MGRGRFFVIVALALSLLVSAAPVSGRPSGSAIELVGAFFVGVPITGSVLHDGYLYVTTSDRLSIYDVTEPTVPTLLATRVSPRSIYGELLSTDGETLLLNNGLAGGTLDVWNVEDKTSPVLVSTMNNIFDEHVTCLLSCSWAYGSEGTIVDLRDPGVPEVRSENWKERTGIDVLIHRVDEFAEGLMATAPRLGSPVVLDVTRPLRPRILARARMPMVSRNPFLYSYWPGGGSGRFFLATSETGQCQEEDQGALLSFDTRGWKGSKSFRFIDSYRYQGRTDSSERGCTSYYFSLHPDFQQTGLILIPNGLEGVRLVSMDQRGMLSETDTFVPPFADVWYSYWLDDEIFYALSTTGEVYILKNS